MGRRTKIAAGTALLTISLLGLSGWLACGRNNKAPALSLGLTAANAADAPFGGFVAWVTNISRATVKLEGMGAFQQESETGKIVYESTVPWLGDGPYEHDPLALPPHGVVAFLPIRIDADKKRFRVSVPYEQEGDKFRAAVSRSLRKLPLNRLPRGVGSWLYRNGWWTGWVQCRYESPWVPNPNAAGRKE